MKKSKQISFDKEVAKFVNETNKECDQLLINFARAIVNINEGKVK